MYVCVKSVSMLSTAVKKKSLDSGSRVKLFDAHSSPSFSDAVEPFNRRLLLQGYATLDEPSGGSGGNGMGEMPAPEDVEPSALE